MRITSIVSLSAALLLAVPVAAQTSSQAGTATTSASAAQTAKPEAEKKICKRLAVSGTRMADRVCLTKTEWEKVEQEK